MLSKHRTVLPSFPHVLHPHQLRAPCTQATPRTSPTPHTPPLPEDPETISTDSIHDQFELDNETGPDDEVAKTYLQVLLVASAIGLTTGCGVVVFNDLVHWIQDHLVWQDMPKLAAFGSDALAIYDPNAVLWRCLLLPPVLAGFAVGGIRHVAGGFSGDPSSVSVKQATSTPKARRLDTVDSDKAPSTSSAQHPISTVNGAIRPVSDMPSQLAGASATAAQPRLEASAGSLPGAREPNQAEATPNAHRQSGFSPSLPGRKFLEFSIEWEIQGRALREARSAARPYMKTLAAAATLGSGASLGPEGPSAELGRAIAASMQHYLPPNSTWKATDLVAAGAGAGVAAGFGAPMSGVLFAVETVLLKPSTKRGTTPPQSPAVPSPATAAHLVHNTTTPQATLTHQLPPPPSSWQSALDDDEEGIQVAAVLVACVFAAMVSTAGLGSEPAFHVPEAVSFQLIELPLGVAVGVVCGAAAAVLAACSASTENAFASLRRTGFPPALLPALGGLTCGCIALLRPEVTYQGFENVNALLVRPHGVNVYSAAGLGALVVAKMVATGVCRSSGLVGGLYAPSIFIGAAVGLALRTAASSVTDTAAAAAVMWLQTQFGLGADLSSPDTYALIGAAAMLAASCRVPLTAVLLLFELTQDYTIILPTLATVGFALWSSAAAKRYVRL